MLGPAREDLRPGQRRTPAAGGQEPRHVRQAGSGGRAEDGPQHGREGRQVLGYVHVSSGFRDTRQVLAPGQRLHRHLVALGPDDIAHHVAGDLEIVLHDDLVATVVRQDVQEQFCVQQLQNALML